MYFSTNEAEQLCISSAACLKSVTELNIIVILVMMIILTVTVIIVIFMFINMIIIFFLPKNKRHWTNVIAIIANGRFLRFAEKRKTGRKSPKSPTSSSSSSSSRSSHLIFSKHRPSPFCMISSPFASRNA